MSKVLQVLKEELKGFHFKLVVVRIVTFFLPIHVGSRLRAYLYRMAGFSIGHGTMFWGTPKISGEGNLYERLTIGEFCWMNDGCFLDLGAPITIGNRVAFGHQVFLMTNSHEIGGIERRAGDLTAAPIIIEDGAWLGARCTILPGVVIHEGAIVAAGSLVTKDVPANTVVAGVPAKVARKLDGEDSDGAHIVTEKIKNGEVPQSIG